MPVGLVSNGTLYFVHPDHLGTPQKITDATQAIAFDLVLRPFGQAEQQTFPSLTNLRFPGQYFDAESSLHQNWLRDYDPTIGRYTESDPIGLRGGNNTYAYVRSNPLRYKDPAGKQIVEQWLNLYYSMHMCLPHFDPPPPPPAPNFCDKAQPYGYPNPYQPYVSNFVPPSGGRCVGNPPETPEIIEPGEPVEMP